jgi:hypothetical protein
MAEGGRDPERLSGLMTDELYERDAPGYRQFTENGWHAVGSITFTMTAQDIDLTSGDIVTYVCEDRSSFDVLDSQSVSIVPSDRPDQSALEVADRDCTAAPRGPGC